MAKNGTQKSLDRAQEIYLTAAQIFFTKGYNASSLNDIADALNITKAGLYYYVESKQDLLYRIINLGLDNVKDRGFRSGARNRRCRRTIEIYNFQSRATFGRRQSRGDYYFARSRVINFGGRKEIMQRRRDYFEFIRETFVRIEEQGKVTKIDLTTATFTLFGMIMWLARWFSPNGKMSVENVCEDICEMALRGFCKKQDYRQF